MSGVRASSLSNVELQEPLMDRQHSRSSSRSKLNGWDPPRPRSITEETTEMYTEQFEDATKELKTWIKAEKQLDVYQMNSFYVAVVLGYVDGCRIKGFFDKGHWYMVGLMIVNFYKTVFTLFIQIGLIRFYLNFSTECFLECTFSTVVRVHINH